MASLVSKGRSLPTRKDHKLLRIQLELIEHIPYVPWCIASATDGLDICSIEHAQDSLVQAFAVFSIGMAIYDGQQKGTIYGARGSCPSICVLYLCVNQV
jgi:hypothetical protein